MNDTEFHQLQLSRFEAFAKRLRDIASAPGGEMLDGLATAVTALSEESAQWLDRAPAQVATMLTTAPQVAELFPRDLLWYLGGECLHFMPDEEIERYSALDEARRASALRQEPFDWQARCAAIQGLQ